MSTDASPLETFLRQATQLYSLPEVALSVLDLTGHPKVDVRALKECIENDPALTGKLLQVVNSSLFSPSREICNLNQAIALLGIKPLKLLVLGFSLPDRLFQEVAADALSRYWRGSLTRAVAAREISERFWNGGGDEAFIAGLLYDVGLLALIQQLGDKFTRFLDKVHSSQADLGTLEEESIGFRHTQLSAALLDHWGLAEELTRAIRFAGNPPSHIENSGRDRLGLILHLADLVARLITNQSSRTLASLHDAGRRSRKIAEESWLELIEELQKKVELLSDVLSLPLSNDLDYRDIVVRAHSELAQLAADTATELALGQGRQRLNSFDIQPDQAARNWSEVRDLAAVITSGTKVSLAGDSAVAVSDPPFPSIAPARTDGTKTANLASELIMPRLRAVVAGCRQARQPLSLLLVALDNFSQYVFVHGLKRSEAALQSIYDKCVDISVDGQSVLRISDDRWACILPDVDRGEVAVLAVQMARSFAPGLVANTSDKPWPATVSVGAATVELPSKNFPAEELLQKAETCLEAAMRSGGNQAKTIAVY